MRVAAVLPLFLFPGLLIIFSQCKSVYDSEDWLKSLTHIVVVSLSFWVHLYWLTMLLPVTLSRLYYLFAGIFAVIFLYKLIANPSSAALLKIKITRENQALCALLLLLIVLRFVPFGDRITGSVGDMTQHNYMTKIIMLNNGYSRSYEPVVPFEHFGEYPLGFHTLSALMAMAGPLLFYRATNWLSCLSLVLITLALAFHLARKVPKSFALSGATFIIMLVHYPQFLNQWGSATTLWSVCFLAFGYNFLESEELWQGRKLGFWEQAALGSLLAAGALTHLIVPIGFLFYLAVNLIVKRRRFADVFGLLPAILWAALAMLPFFINFNFHVVGQSAQAIHFGHAQSLSKILEPFHTSQWGGLKLIGESAVGFAFVFGPAYVFLLATSAAFLVWKKESSRVLWSCAGSVLLYVLLFCSFKTDFLPLSHLIQTERFHYFLLWPCSTLIILALNSLRQNMKWGIKAGGGLLFLVLFYANARDLAGRSFESHYTTYKFDGRWIRFLARDALLGSYFAAALDKANASLTGEDIEAFNWVKESIDRDAVFLYNYGDGGALLSSIAERKTFSPHGMEVWHGKELAEWQHQNPPTHIYVGKSANPKYEKLYSAPALDAQSDKYVKLYDRRGVSIYNIVKRN